MQPVARIWWAVPETTYLCVLQVLLTLKYSGCCSTSPVVTRSPADPSVVTLISPQVETLTQTERSTTVMAIRDTEVAKLSDGLINFIKLKYPIVVSRLIELLGHRILGSWKARSASPLGGGGALSAVVEQRPSQTNFNTVALLPVSEDVPLVSFSFELLHSLLAIGTGQRCSGVCWWCCLWRGKDVDALRLGMV